MQENLEVEEEESREGMSLYNLINKVICTMTRLLNLKTNIG